VLVMSLALKVTIAQQPQFILMSVCEQLV